MKELFERYLSYLRDLSYKHSEENKVFIKNKILAHKFYMEGLRKTSPYLHPDSWQDDREEQLSKLEG
tara:strand:+ start:838 stop:1038 length:201 start_codon:yes stop_codon:yes gene_type:complete